MSEKHRVIPAVFIAVYDNENVLLHKRANTGYRDDQYDMPSGHIELNETTLEAAARELKEEAGLLADPKDFELFHVTTNDSETPERPYLYLFCKIALAKCQGQYHITEPEKCVEIGMFSTDNLPENTSVHTATALQYLGSQAVTFYKTAF